MVYGNIIRKFLNVFLFFHPAILIGRMLFRDIYEKASPRAKKLALTE